MTPTAEQVIDAIRKLPGADLERVRSWIATATDDKPSLSKNGGASQDRFKRAMAWIDVNRENYLNMWVALDGDTLLAYGKDGKDVRAEAARKSPVTPLMHLITRSETQPFGGLD